MDYKEFREKYDIENDKIRSWTWNMGGDWADCWGNGGAIEPEPQPDSFDEFDKIIEKIAPNITFMQYKRIYSASVRVESERESDYYGGTAYKGYFECDVYRLYEELKERGLLED